MEKKQESGNTSNCSDSDDDSDKRGGLIEPDSITSSDDDEVFIKDMINIDRKISRSNYIDGEPINSLARKCHECDKVFKNLSSLYAHKRFVHISEDMYSVCVHCGKRYKRSKDLRNHMTQIHREEMHKNCGDAVQDDHIRTTDVSSKRFMCPQCDYATTTSTHLKLHIRRHHTGEKPYVCEICGNSFITSYDLKKHRYLHTGEKPYKCTVCPKTFRVSSKLKKHQRVHTGERPFKCTECGKGFTQEYNLSVHKRTHTGEKPYKCPLCPKAFRVSAKLRKHKLVHTGERPYKCTECGKGFTQAYNLTVHKRTHLKEQTSYPDSVLNEKLHSDDDGSLNDSKSMKTEDDPTHNPLECGTRKASTKEISLNNSNKYTLMDHVKRKHEPDANNPPK
ncbi:zinc finger protein 664-like [Musca vetustissima]|uniref:zinc finger protein 664-like n=1 Tax=Musca vetustissima TaxID=27455 RepID=UPI002AB5FA90|nr:zinc finger protein 664-like [Musca vetustissima]